MELMFDTGNLELIKFYSKVFPIVGVTTNPSILKKEGKVDVWEHFRQIQFIIGKNNFLHVQVTTDTTDEIVKEAHKIVDELGYETYVKIPTTIDGVRAIKILKKENFKITATAIYTMAQGDFAIMAGADYIAPYVNRMENINIDSKTVIKHYAQLIKEYNKETKILAASFKNMGQVMSAYECGAHCTTVDPTLLADALKMPSIEEATVNFKKDWEGVFGEGVSLLDL